jgi:CBS domain-containing protein
VRAVDLVEQVPVVSRSSSALEAAAVVAGLRVSGVVVVDEAGQPVAVVPGTQLLRLVVPPFVRADPALAHVYDEAGADEVCARLRDKSVGDLLDDEDAERVGIPEVLPEDTLVEISAVMLAAHSPVVVVRDRSGVSTGVVTLSRLLAAVLAAAGEGGPALDTTLTRDLADLHGDQHGDLHGDPQRDRRDDR